MKVTSNWFDKTHCRKWPAVCVAVCIGCVVIQSGQVKLNILYPPCTVFVPVSSKGTNIKNIDQKTTVIRVIVSKSCTFFSGSRCSSTGNSEQHYNLNTVDTNYTHQHHHHHHHQQQQQQMLQIFIILLDQCHSL